MIPTEKTSEKIRKICADVFNLKYSEMSGNMSKENTPEWDSLNNLMLLTEIEKEYKIKFSAKEINKIKSLEDIETILKEKCLH